MQLSVRYFAAAADAAGREDELLDAPDDATVGWLRTHLAQAYGPAMTAAIRNGSFLVDGVAQTDDAVALAAAVDVLPPFAGG